MRSDAFETAAGITNLPSGVGESKYFRLQYLRAIAAYCVVFFHAAYYLNFIRGDDRVFSRIPPNLGGFGVSLFFVISGYLMASLAPKTPADRFIAHRIIRIYPIYWLVLILFVPINRRLGYGFTLDPLAILLFPGDHRNYALGVEWTLPFELSFYLVIFIIILAKWSRFLPAIAAAWAAIIVSLMYLRPDLQQGQFPRLALLLISEWTLPFAFGLLIPFAVRQGLVGVWTVWPAVALLVFIYLQPNSGQEPLAVASFFLVAWAVAPRSAVNDKDRLKLVTRFGDWSYALYLCHDPIINWSYRKIPSHLGSVGAFAFAIILVIATTSVLGNIDLALYRELKTRVDQSRNIVRYALASIFATTFLVYSAYEEATAARDRNMLTQFDSLGRGLSTAVPIRPEEFDSGLESNSLTRDPQLRGHIDVLARDINGTVRLAGWALDGEKPNSEAAALIFYDGQYWGAALLQWKRPDVIAGLSIRSLYSRPGFDATIGSQPCDTSGALRVVVVTLDKRFSSLPIPPGATLCALDAARPTP